MFLSGTLEIDGSGAVVVGVAAMDGLWWITPSDIRKNCCIFFAVAVDQVLDGFGTF